MESQPATVRRRTMPIVSGPCNTTLLHIRTNEDLSHRDTEGAEYQLTVIL
jgi:hypothetical protein